MLDNQVSLTLTTSTEDVAELSIYRRKEEEKGILQVKEICYFDSKGTKVSGWTYECVDKDVSEGTYQYWPASIDYNTNYTTHYLDKEIEVIIQK